MNPDSKSNSDPNAEHALRAALYRVMRSHENHDSLDQNDIAFIAENGLRGLKPEIRDKLTMQLLSDADQLESVVELYNFVQAQSNSSQHHPTNHTEHVSNFSAFSWLKPVFAVAASVAVLSASGLIIELTRGNSASDANPDPKGFGPHMSDAVNSANSTAFDLTLVFSIVCALALSVAAAAFIVLHRRARRSRLVQHHEPGVGSEPG